MVFSIAFISIFIYPYHEIDYVLVEISIAKVKTKTKKTGKAKKKWKSLEAYMRISTQQILVYYFVYHLINHMKYENINSQTVIAYVCDLYEIKYLSLSLLGKEHCVLVFAFVNDA